MKRFMMGAALVAMAMVGCKNEEVVKNNEGQMFTLEVGKGMKSRTHLNGNQLVWSAGDEIFVTSPDGEVSGVLRLISGENTPNGVFRGEVNGNPENLKNIVYPVQLGGMNLANADAQKLVAPMTGTINGENTLSLNCGLAKMNVLGLEDGEKVKVSADGIGSTLRYDLQTNKWIPMETSNDDITIYNAKDATDFIVPVYTENTNSEETTTLKVSVIDNQDEEGGSTQVEVAIVREQVNESTPILAVTDDGAVVDPKTSSNDEVKNKYVYVKADGTADGLKTAVEAAEEGAYIVLDEKGTYPMKNQINIYSEVTILGNGSKLTFVNTERGLNFDVKKGVEAEAKDLEFEGNPTRGYIWFKAHQSEEITYTLENVACASVEFDNAYNQNAVVIGRLKNCNIGTVSMIASILEGKETISVLEYDGKTSINEINVRERHDGEVDSDLSRIFINGENPESYGVQ